MIPDLSINLVKQFEGLHRQRSDGLIHPYVCPAGVWTIGWGSIRDLDGRPIGPFTAPKTEDECEALLTLELEGCQRSMARLSPQLIAEPETRQSAIISFIYNVGTGAYQSSTLRRKVNARLWHDAAYQMKRWVFGGGRKLRGLELRRAVESELLLR